MSTRENKYVSYNCGNSFTKINQTATDIDDIKDKNIKIYHSDDYLVINFLSLSEGVCFISFFNYLGIIFHNFSINLKIGYNQTSFDIRNISNGVYTISIKTIYNLYNKKVYISR